MQELECEINKLLPEDKSKLRSFNIRKKNHLKTSYFSRQVFTSGKMFETEQAVPVASTTSTRIMMNNLQHRHHQS